MKNPPFKKGDKVIFVGTSETRGHEGKKYKGIVTGYSDQDGTEVLYEGESSSVLSSTKYLKLRSKKSTRKKLDSKLLLLASAFCEEFIRLQIEGAEKSPAQREADKIKKQFERLRARLGQE